MGSTYIGNFPRALYRHFDKEGVLLYVGSSHNPMHRWGAHHTTAHWTHDTVSITITWYADHWTGLAAERVAIKTENPKYNIASKPRPCQSCGCDKVSVGTQGLFKCLPCTAIKASKVRDAKALAEGRVIAKRPRGVVKPPKAPAYKATAVCPKCGALRVIVNGARVRFRCRACIAVTRREVVARKAAAQGRLPRRGRPRIYPE